MHPAELLQGVFRPEVVPIIEMRPKVSHGRDYQDGVPWEVADSLATAKPTLQSLKLSCKRRTGSTMSVFSGERNEWKTGSCE